ncbi:MAG: hypothetical protein AAGF28_02625 [Pseudomonadota bacterium]
MTQFNPSIAPASSAGIFVPSLVQRITRAFVLPFLAMFVALAGMQAVTTTPAEAGVLKKVKIGSKWAGKGFRKMEKAGRKMSKKKGIAGKLGKAMQKTGRGGRKASKGLRKGISKGQRAANRQLAKSKVGRGALKAGKAYKKARKSTIGKAFKRCKNTEVCEGLQDGADFLIPG